MRFRELRDIHYAMRICKLILISAFVLFVGSCASGPVVIAEDLTPAELVQRGQEASEKANYGQAIQYYQAILERFPDDSESVCTAEYEIAYIKYKQKKYEEAEAGFRALLARYDEPDAELLPPQFKILAEKVLSRMELD